MKVTDIKNVYVIFSHFIILFIIYFSDRPLVQITNSSNSKKFYEVGKMYSVECYIGGYPLPEVEWAFKKCPNYPECEESFIQISVNQFIDTYFITN